MDTKGQAATEYLMILAVVVAIALIVVNVIGGFPMFKTMSRIESEAYWKNAEISVEQMRIEGASGDVQLILKNMKSMSVQIVGINVAGKPLSSPQFNNIVLLPGARVILSASGGPAGAPGADYSHEVAITYRDANNPSFVYSFPGDKPWVGKYQ